MNFISIIPTLRLHLGKLRLRAALQGIHSRLSQDGEWRTLTFVECLSPVRHYALNPIIPIVPMGRNVSKATQGVSGKPGTQTQDLYQVPLIKGKTPAFHPKKFLPPPLPFGSN